MYCVYSGHDVEDSQFGQDGEHIIPRSLGGSNGFCIPVCKGKNRLANQKIDNPMEQTVIAQMMRDIYAWKGAKGKSFQGVNVLVNDQDRAKLHIKEGFVYVDGKQEAIPLGQFGNGAVLCSTSQIDSEASDLIKRKYVAKCALGAMYYLFGEASVKSVEYNGLRNAAFDGLYSDNVHYLPMYNSKKPNQYTKAGGEHYIVFHEFWDSILSSMVIPMVERSAIYVLYGKPSHIDCYAVIGSYIVGGCRFFADVKALEKQVQSRSMFVGRDMLGQMECIICVDRENTVQKIIEFKASGKGEYAVYIEGIGERIFTDGAFFD